MYDDADNNNNDDKNLLFDEKLKFPHVKKIFYMRKC